jgi:hypothetical protein
LPTLILAMATSCCCLIGKHKAPYVLEARRVGTTRPAVLVQYELFDASVLVVLVRGSY